MTRSPDNGPVDGRAEEVPPGDVHPDDLSHDEAHEDLHRHEDLHHDEDHPEDEDWFADGDGTLADDVIATGVHPDDVVDEDERPRRKRKHRSPAVRWGAILLALVIVLGGGFFGARALGDLVPSFDFGSGAPEDFEGEGSGEVEIEIPGGAGGGEIGQVLYDAGVVASPEAFSNVAAADPRATAIQPGSYTMAKEMSASAALERLLDSESRNVARVTLREGLWTSEVFALLAEGTGNEVADYEAVDPESLDLPDAADGELEGFLAPDTYSFAPDDTPEEQLRQMVALGNQRYQELGVPEDELRETLTIASIIEGEAANPDDFAKVSRVIQNRLDEGEGLRMDSTIHFIHQERGRVGTTDEQRKVESPYNTYLHEGLPPGPINNPGAAAIEAAMNPADGDWMYFVTINPDTGETVFTETLEEHEEQAEIFQQWCEENPDRC